MDLKRSFNRFRALIRRGNIFVSHDIWAINRENLTSWKSRLVRDFQVIITTMRSFKERGIGFQSVALSYFCTMAFVPLVAACIGLTNAFGLENQLHEIVNNFLGGEQQEVIDFVINAAEVILEEASSGIFGIISALMFIWLVIWMMNRVEVVFNNVWKVEEKTRKFYHSYGVDIIILFLIPFVILIFGAGGIVYTDVLDLVFKDFPVSEIKTFFGLIMLALISIAIFSAMYKFIPNTKVYYKYALKGAIPAGIAFAVLQYLYLETQVMVTRINAVYGTLAAIPLFMIWMRFSWLIILYGAQFSYAFQTVDGVEEELK